MVKVAKDMYVSVEYTGTLDNGEVFDTSQGRQPLEIQMGAGQLIKGFEDALDGMTLNEKKPSHWRRTTPMASRMSPSPGISRKDVPPGR
ncbi:MAG: FKBP-type peptidyl-prolyl cis-trans isomerase [Desulfobacterales bacterium]